MNKQDYDTVRHEVQLVNEVVDSMNLVKLPGLISICPEDEMEQSSNIARSCDGPILDTGTNELSIIGRMKYEVLIRHPDTKQIFINAKAEVSGKFVITDTSVDAEAFEKMVKGLCVPLLMPIAKSTLHTMSVLAGIPRFELPTIDILRSIVFNNAKDAQTNVE